MPAGAAAAAAAGAPEPAMPGEGEVAGELTF